MTPDEKGIVVLALMLVYVLIKEVVAPMVRRRNGNGIEQCLKQLVEIAKIQTIMIRDMKGQQDDLWEWHKPDDSGVQPWKGQHIMQALKDLPDKVRTAIKG